MPGSGKSTVGRHLSRRLNLEFRDSDQVIEERIGCSIREFFAREGEDRFRDIEQQVIAELDKLPLPTSITPHDEGAEWYVTARRLCALIEAVGDLDVTRINPGVANKAEWASVSFKGGSETGVLNLTTLLVARDGTRYCVAATWNDDKAIDETKATTAYASLVAKLARE